MLEYSLRELTRRWKRTLITVSGYFAAVTFLCILLTAITGAGRASGAILSSTGTHFIAYTPVCEGGSCPTTILDPEHEGFYVASARTRLMNNSMLATIKTLPSVADAAPFLLFRIRNNEGTASYSIGGLDPEASVATAKNCCAPGDVTEGRFLLPGDDNAVMLEASYATSARLNLNDIVTIGTGAYTVIGIVEPGVRPAKADVYMTIIAAEKIIAPRIQGDFLDNSSLFMIESKSSHLHNRAMADVRRVMGSEALLSSYNCYQPAAKADTITKRGADLAALLVYICIIIFSLQSQLHSVTERKHEIGIVTAIGWSRRDIASQIVYESLIQAFAGWLAGVTVSTSIVALIRLLSPDAAVDFMPEVYVISFILALSSGAIAGLIPGLAAANKKPAECLRKY